MGENVPIICAGIRPFRRIDRCSVREQGAHSVREALADAGQD